MVCFGELGWRAGDELFVVGLELGLGGAGVMLFVVENGKKGLYFEYGSGKIGVTKLQDI